MLNLFCSINYRFPLLFLCQSKQCGVKCAGGSDINNAEKLVRISAHDSNTGLDGLSWTFATQDTIEKVSRITEVVKPFCFGFCLFACFGFFLLVGCVFVCCGGKGAGKKWFLNYIVTSNEQIVTATISDGCIWIRRTEGDAYNASTM